MARPTTTRVVRGILAPVSQGSPKRILMIHEGPPFWLGALRREDVLAIQSWCPREISTEGPMWASLRAYFGERLTTCVSYTVALTSIGSFDIVLGSGSPIFLKASLPLYRRTPVMAVITGGNDGIRAPRRVDIGSGWKWIRVSHAGVGGVTTGAYLVGSIGVELTQRVPVLQRTIRHFLNYSIRGLPHRGEEDRSRFYYEDDRLRPLDLARSVVYRSSFSSTGVCSRALTPREIGLAFDYPLWVLPAFEKSPTLISGPPFKVLSAVWSDFLTITAVDQLPGPRPERPARWDLPSPPPAVTWLPLLGRHLPHSWIDPSLVTEKSVKSDRDGVPSQLWDLRISLVLPSSPTALSTLRVFFTRVWRRRLLRSLLSYLRGRYGASWFTTLGALLRRHQVARPLKRQRGGIDPGIARGWGGIGTVSFLDRSSLSSLLLDVEVGASVLHQNCSSSWWEWTEGSALIFWRWPTPSLIAEARDGTPFFVSGQLPTNRRPQRPPPAHYLPLVAEKIANILAKGYIVPGLVRSLTTYFQVPKGLSDLRMVYDGTSSGLNDALWAPAFWMPTPDTALRQVSYYTYCVDIDLGEMFLNFPMDRTIQPYAGVDLSPLMGQLWLSWGTNRTLLGNGGLGCLWVASYAHI